MNGLLTRHYEEHLRLKELGFHDAIVDTQESLIGHYESFTDFMSLYEGGLYSYPSGTGAAYAVGSLTHNRIGICYVGKGTTATGYAYGSQGLASISLGYGIFTLEGEFYLDNLADETNDYSVIIGLNDALGSEPTDGVYFRYCRSESLYWQCKCANNSTRTATVDAITDVLVDTSWKRFKIVVNAAASQAKFYIGNVLVKTITANIPSGYARACGASFGIIGIAGTADRVLRADWLYLSYEFSGARA